jgi:hypothetical protein
MKKLFMICLMAGYSHCFAQNIDLRELQQIQEAPGVEQINKLLAPKGYTLPKESSSLIWGFQTDAHPETSNVAQIYRVKDTIGIKLIYETANPFFYTNLVNQLPANGFQFRQTLTEKNNVNLVFSNGKQELLLDVALADDTDKPYRITLQPVSSLRTSLNPQYNNHSVRKLGF